MRTNIIYCKTHQRQKNLTVECCPGCLVQTLDENATLRTRIAELEAAIRDWYEWSWNASMDDEPLDRLNDIAKALLDGRGE